MDLVNPRVFLLECPYFNAMLGSLVISLDVTILGNITGTLPGSSVGIPTIALVVNWAAYLLGIFTSSLMCATIGLWNYFEVNIH